MKVNRRFSANISARPHWMNALLLFCAYMTFIYLPWDLFIKPVAVDQEVWLGILFSGWSAKVGGLLHWLVYGAGLYGFVAMKSWMHPWAAIYVLQIALSMAVFAALAEGSGVLVGVSVALLFVLLAWALWRGRRYFDKDSDGQQA